MEQENKNFIFEKAIENDFDEIKKLYKNVIKTTFTTWGENYPSDNLLFDDIKNEQLFILRDNSKIIAVSFLGTKNNDTEDWSLKLSSPMFVARICVSPDYQGKGIGSYFMNQIICEAKNRGADGMHFHVCTKNPAAIKMYEKVGFENYGRGQSNYGFDFFKFEQKF